MISNGDSFCPYVGLDPYGEAQRDFFFGRVQDTRRIVSNLYASPSTVLFGASGVGKSSVLQAGVVPLLRAKPRTALVVFNTWQSAFFLNALKTQCVQTVQTLIPDELQIDSNLPLDELLAGLAQAINGTIFLLFDQFEEYFAYQAEDLGETGFEAQLARAMNTDEIGASFLFVMREDAFAKLDRFGARMPYLLTHILRLRHLNTEQATEAIRNPLEVYNQRFTGHPVKIEDELVPAILNQVQRGRVRVGQGGVGITRPQQEGIETPFLQIVMTRLWHEEMRAGSFTLRLATFNHLGGAEQIIKQHLDGSMNSLSGEQQEIAAATLNYLITPDGTKIAHTASSLGYYAQVPIPRVKQTMQILSSPGLRILRPVPKLPEDADEQRFEIFHDTLAPALLDWRARFYRRSVAPRRINLVLAGLFLFLFVLQFFSLHPFILAVTRAAAYLLLSSILLNLLYRLFFRYVSLFEISIATTPIARQFGLFFGIILGLFVYSATDWGIYASANPLGNLSADDYLVFLYTVFFGIVVGLLVFLLMWFAGIITKKVVRQFQIGFYGIFLVASFALVLFSVLKFLGVFDFVMIEPFTQQ